MRRDIRIKLREIITRGVILLLHLNLDFIWYIDGRTAIASIHVLIAPHSWQSVDEEEKAYYADKDDANNDSCEPASAL